MLKKNYGKSFGIYSYIINLKKRSDRKFHILKEFSKRDEFKLQIKTPVYGTTPENSLWKTIQEIVLEAKNMSLDYLLLCEDDHQFTDSYSKDRLLECISYATSYKYDIILGGVSWFSTTCPMTNDLFWVEKFTGLQFTVVFKSFYDRILDHSLNFGEVADGKISRLSNKKLLIFPFISVQKSFGYSDVTLKNNIPNRVEDLFKKSSRKMEYIINVSKSLRNIPAFINFEKLNESVIPTYIINLSSRTDRLKHILEQFEGKKEFLTEIVEGEMNANGALGLWNTIRKIIGVAKKSKQEVIVICEDDHQFTEQYSKEFFFEKVLEAHHYGANILIGGISNFGCSVRVNPNIFWIDSFYCTQFIVLFEPIFDKILNESFDNSVTADGWLSKITSNKFVIHPFISVQKYLGESDINNTNSIPGYLENQFLKAEKRLMLIGSQSM